MATLVHVADTHSRLPPWRGRRSESTRGVDRQIVALAVPAFLALVAEPLFLLADSAIVGHLGTAELAGLGIASVVLRLAIGLCVFLAYATTAAVARRASGPGSRRRGAQPRASTASGWPLLIGVVLTVAGVAAHRAAHRAVRHRPDVAAAATTYLRIAWLGLAPMLLLLAATGVLRGLARHPHTAGRSRWRRTCSTSSLNVVLVYGFDLGIAGSALGTDARPARPPRSPSSVVVVRGARREGAPCAPTFPAYDVPRAPAGRCWSGPSTCRRAWSR